MSKCRMCGLPIPAGDMFAEELTTKERICVSCNDMLFEHNTQKVKAKYPTAELYDEALTSGEYYKWARQQNWREFDEAWGECPEQNRQ